MRFAQLLSFLQAGLAVAGPLVPNTQPETRSLAPRAGQTYFNVGQNYANEWNGFQSGVKKPAGISVYGNIYDGTLNSDSQNLLATYAGSNRGYVEIGLSWKDDMVSHGYSQFEGARLCNDIAAGKFDSSLHTFTQYLSRFPNVKFLLRVDYEVSGNLHANTNPTQFDQSTFDLKAYPAAFAHVRQVVLGAVKNVEFVFHPVRGSAQQLYPGDNVVDWQGFSVFNNDVCLNVGSTSNCVGSRIDPNILKDIQFAKKPKIIAESAVQPPAAGNQNDFIDYLTRVRDMVEQYDFAAWTYINSNWNAHGWDAATWGDSRVETHPAVLQWFQQNIANNPRYIFG
ncbi:hypothetical protein F5Y12DRAFT_78866 [Xylaria sp. FL1777]|nr:hypothetical protein F5Y12DRAFT_78866 [Xylaria sp. FL1777]